MDYNWLMITHALIGGGGHEANECRDQNSNGHKKVQILTNHASAFMKDRINTKVTHRHMLVDLRGMAVEELQNLPQCFIIDLFGP